MTARAFEVPFDREVWERSGTRLEREYAVRLLVTDEQPPRIQVEFRSADTCGKLDVCWSPRIEIAETSLAC